MTSITVPFKSACPLAEASSRVCLSDQKPFMPLLKATLLALISFGAAAEALIDGPYVLHQDKTRQAIWVCDGEVKSVALATGAKLTAPCGSVTGFSLNASKPIAPDQLPQPRRWAAVSDIHGQATLFLSLLRAQKISAPKTNGLLAMACW